MSNFNTPYDDAFRTLLTDCPHLIIPVVNELFRENFSLTDPVDLQQNESFITNGKDQKRITDSHFSIGNNLDRRYHIECESRPDGSILIRIFEYASQIAMQGANYAKGIYTVCFPNSGVLCLRKGKEQEKRMKIRIITPGGEVSYLVPVIQMQDYTLEVIFERKLWFLLPFYFFNYSLKEMDNDQTLIQKMQETYEEIFERLNVLAAQKVISEYDRLAIKAMCEKVALALTKRYQNVKEGVKQIMGGQVLEYEAKTILKKGIQQGIEMTRLESIQKLTKNLGMSPEEAMSALEISEAEYQKYRDALIE